MRINSKLYKNTKEIKGETLMNNIENLKKTVDEIYKREINSINKNLTNDELQIFKKFLEICSFSYYNTAKKIISDDKFDKYIKFYDSIEGTERIIGAEPDPTNKHTISVVHKFPELVGTLDKANCIEDIEEWLLKCYNNDKSRQMQIIVTLKFDGNSIVCYYKNGKLVLAITRGKNGKGVDLTWILSKNDQIKEIDTDEEEIAVKFESIITYEDFDRFPGERVNPRSLISGLFGRNDADQYANFVYNVPLWIKSSQRELNRFEELELIENIFGSENFNSLNCFLCEGNFNEVINDIKQLYEKFIEERVKDDFGFMIDGLVIEIADDKMRKELGYVKSEAKSIPNWAIALKFPYLEAETEVDHFEFTVSKNGTGIISPMCYFKPVTFLHSTHTKQLIPYNRFKELKLGVGSPILIEYRNDVLTYIEKMDTDLVVEPIEFPKKCPICGAPVISNKEDTFKYCSSDDCPSKLIGKINNYLTKMDIKGIKENKIKSLFDNGVIKDIESLYHMDIKKVKEILGPVEGQKTYDAIVGKKDVYDYEVIGSIGIEDFSLESAKLLCKNIDIYEFTLLIENNKISDKYNDLININGFSDITVNKLINGSEKNLELLKFLLNELNVKKLKDEIKIDSKTYNFVITGSLNNFANRDQLKDILEKRGHKISGSVSKKTDFLINNDKESNTGKNKKAKELGINIISENDLIKLLNM